MKKLQISGSLVRGFAAGLGVLACVSAANATPYASHVVVAGSTVSFILNEPATDVSIVYGGNLATNDMGALARGSQSFSLTYSGTNYTTYSIVVSKTGSGSPSQISVDGVNVSFEGPRSVAVNRNPQRSYFGTTYNINASPGNGGLRTVGKGLYAVNADQSDAFGYGATVMPPVGTGPGQIQWGSSTTYGGFKVFVGPDDMVYAGDASGATGAGTTVGGGTWAVSPNLSSAIDLFPYNGTADPPSSSNLVCTASRSIAYGSLATGNLVIFQAEWNRSPFNNVWEYDIGSTNTLPWTNSPTTEWANEGISGVNEVVLDLDISPSGHFYCTEDRGTATGGNVSLTIYDSTTNGNGYLWDSSTAAGGTDPFVGTYSSSVSPDEKYVAVIQGAAGLIEVAPLTFSQNGATNLPDVTKIFTITTGMSGTTRGIAWDAADNIYVNSGGDDLMRVYSLGLTTTAVTGGDNTGTNGTFQLLTPGASVTVVADTNTAYKNQLLSTESGNNGPSAGDFLLTRSGGTLASPLTVNFTMSGTAVANTDYSLTPSSLTSITFAANQTTTNISLLPIHTGVPEPTTTAILTIAGSVNYSAAAPFNTATVTISDDSTPTIQMVPTTYNVFYEPNQYDYSTYAVTRLGNTNTNFVVNVSYTSPSGTASPSDFSGPSTVTVNLGDATDTLKVMSAGNLTPSGSNSIVATVLSGTGYSVAATSFSATNWVIYDEVPQGKVLFSDSFDTSSTNGGLSTSSNYNVLYASVDGTPNYTVTIPFDYSTLGIPSAPHTTGGTTLGAQIAANSLTSDLAMGVNIYPVLSSFPGVTVSAFSNSFAMRVDMFLVENTASQTTEYAIFGINHSGTHTNWFDNSNATGPGNAWQYDGLWYDVEDDGASLGDYVLQTAPVSSAGANNDPTPYGSRGFSTVTNIFKANPWTIGANTGGAPANQLPASGSFAGHTPSWATVEIDQVISKTATNVTMKINNVTMISYTNNKTATEPFTGGNVMLGHDDAYDGNIVAPFQGQAIYDNLSVTQLILKITSIQVVSGTVTITFTWGLDEAASVFALQSSASDVTPLTDNGGATITRTGVGTYTATIPVSGSMQYYQVRHQ